MSKSERHRRLRAIADILAKRDMPLRLRDDLEDLRAELMSCTLVQDKVARTWQAAAHASCRRHA